jgi:hypothetical protein
MRLAHLPKALSLLGLVLVGAGCQRDAAPSLHEVQLFGAQNTSLSYVYGGPTTLKIQGTKYAITQGKGEDPLWVFGAALIDEKPYLRMEIEEIEAPASVHRIPLTTDLLVNVFGPVEEIAYFDGVTWFTLVKHPGVGLSKRLIPVPRVGRMRGLGQLSRQEADVLANAFEERGQPFALYQIPDGSLERKVIGGLDEHLITGLFLDEDLQVDSAAFDAPAQTAQWEVLASGSNSGGVDEESYFLAANRTEFLELWSRGHADALMPPDVPDVNFDLEVVIGVLLGERPTSGYGLSVEGIEIEGDDLFIDVAKTTPTETSMVAQVVTSPWVIIRVLRRGVNVAWFRDSESGALIGVSQAFR